MTGQVRVKLTGNDGAVYAQVAATQESPRRYRCNAQAALAGYAAAAGKPCEWIDEVGHKYLWGGIAADHLTEEPATNGALLLLVIR